MNWFEWRPCPLNSVLVARPRALGSRGHRKYCQASWRSVEVLRSTIAARGKGAVCFVVECRRMLVEGCWSFGLAPHHQRALHQPLQACSAVSNDARTDKRRRGIQAWSSFQPSQPPILPSSTPAATDRSSSKASACLAAPSCHHVANRRPVKQRDSGAGRCGATLGTPVAAALHSIVAVLHQPSIGRQPRQAHADRSSAALDRNLLSQGRNGFRLATSPP